MQKSLFLSLIAIFYTFECNSAEYITSKKDIDPLSSAARLAMSGIQMQNERMKIISQNIANIDVTGSTPGGDPYRRKMISFENTVDRSGPVVKVKKIEEHQSDFVLK